MAGLVRRLRGAGALRWSRTVVLTGVLSSLPMIEPSYAAPAAATVAALSCRALSAAVDATPGVGPVFVASYGPAPDETALPGPLAGAAFVYDNAAAAIALVACDRVDRASRIGDAILAAMQRDRHFTDGRIRNAYRAGPVSPGTLPLPGWWDGNAHRWDEDAYMDGTATGNVAWAALALLTLDTATRREAYREGAVRLLRWIAEQTRDAPGPPGFAGGVTGFDGQQQRLTWKSTEHNTDVAAAAAWLHTLTGDASSAAMADTAGRFVATRFVMADAIFFSAPRPMALMPGPINTPSMHRFGHCSACRTPRHRGAGRLASPMPAYAGATA